MQTSRVQVYRNNRPAKGVRVAFEYDGLSQMGFTETFYTNDDGVTYVHHGSTGWANVYLDGREQSDKINTPGQEIFYL